MSTTAIIALLPIHRCTINLSPMESSRAPAPPPSNERATRQSRALPPARSRVLPPSKQPSNRYHATPNNVVAASRRSERVSSLTKASVANNSTATSVDRDDDTPDLSQNLLDDNATSSKATDNITKDFSKSHPTVNYYLY